MLKESFDCTLQTSSSIKCKRTKDIKTDEWADRKTKEWYAIKSILKSKVKKVDILKREIEILAEVNHKNILTPLL